MKGDLKRLRWRLAVAVASFPVALVPAPGLAEEAAGAEADVVEPDEDAAPASVDGDSAPRNLDDADQAPGRTHATPASPDEPPPEEEAETYQRPARLGGPAPGTLEPGEEVVAKPGRSSGLTAGGYWITPSEVARRRMGREARGEALGCPEHAMQVFPPGSIMGEGGSVVLNVGETKALREAGDARCYYDWHTIIVHIGRALRGEDAQQVVAPLRAGVGWCAASTLDGASRAALGQLDAATRARLARLWLEDAQLEHASVASFARATLEVMQHDPPPELLAALQQGGLDEVDHARRCLRLAALYGAAASRPEGMRPPAPRQRTLAALAVDALVEGALGETMAIAVAARALSRCEVPVVRASLTVILDDETRHAALAWATIAWAIERGGAPVRQALREVAGGFERAARDVALPPAAEDEATLARHGRVEGRARVAVCLEAWRHVVRPGLEALALL